MATKKNIKLWLWVPAISVTLSAGMTGLAYWYRRPIPTWSEENDESLIRTFLPEAEFAGELSIEIHAAPEAVYAAIQRVTLDDMPIAKVLGQLRYLPARLTGKAKPTTQVQPQAVPFLDFLQTESANIILAQAQNREIVVGAIGQFHNLLNQHFAQLRSPEEFINFDHPDYQKLAMSFKIIPLNKTASRLTFVHGTHALSPASRRKFALYWLGIKPGGNFVSWQMLRAIQTIAEQQPQQRVVSQAPMLPSSQPH